MTHLPTRCLSLSSSSHRSLCETKSHDSLRLSQPPIFLLCTRSPRCTLSRRRLWLMILLPDHVCFLHGMAFLFLFLCCSGFCLSPFHRSCFLFAHLSASFCSLPSRGLLRRNTSTLSLLELLLCGAMVLPVAAGGLTPLLPAALQAGFAA